MKPGDIVLGTFHGAVETKLRPAVVLSSEIYLRERPDVIVGILTSKLPVRLATTDHVLRDWRQAGLRIESCFRAYILTIDQREVTIIGWLSEHDWRAVKLRVSHAIET
ncbi:MAG: type II toxin-antitoxin system PemK/MazF family toxin [Acidobacteria bacterium]|nr:type II toxin-antitoxin system PemK/MazF family toxin [Acidobacteriota bacterium]